MIRLRRRCVNPARRAKQLERYGMIISQREGRDLLPETVLRDISWPLASTIYERQWTHEHYSAPILETQRLGREKAERADAERREQIALAEWAAARAQEEEKREAREMEARRRAIEASERVAEPRRLAEPEPKPRRLTNELKIISAPELQALRDEAKRLEKLRAEKVAELTALREKAQRQFVADGKVPPWASAAFQEGRPAPEPQNVTGLIKNREGFRKYLERTMPYPPEPWTEAFRNMWFSFNQPNADGISPNQMLLLQHQHK